MEAGSAEEALRLLRDGAAIDLLVTDHLMPGMSGADLAREARPLRPGLPVLIVSGYAEVDGLAPDLPRLAKPFRSRSWPSVWPPSCQEFQIEGDEVVKVTLPVVPH